MTENEARIARIAMMLTQDTPRMGYFAKDVIERFIQTYDPERPCSWKLECIMTGRCPKEMVCDN